MPSLCSLRDLSAQLAHLAEVWPPAAVPRAPAWQPEAIAPEVASALASSLGHSDAYNIGLAHREVRFRPVD